MHCIWLFFCIVNICLRLSEGHRILVVGGAGRVGGSAVRALVSRFPSSTLVVGGRDVKNWEVCKERHRLTSVSFLPMDISSEESIASTIPSFDLIIHTAGPFQGLRNPLLLRHALQLGKKYIDVCDDVPLSAICRSEVFQQLAIKHKSSAIISTGIWPGGSSLLAQKVIEAAGGHANVRNVTFSFFTAGSGGAGPTILTATFLILGEDVITYQNNQLVYKKSATDKRVVDFGEGIGRREVVRLSLIECESCHISGIGNVETFFGTAPPFWNTLFALMANIIPQKWLQERNKMTILAKISLPMVRLIDSFVGSKNGTLYTYLNLFLCICLSDGLHTVGIRVDVVTNDDQVFTGIMSHEDLETAVGDSIAAFAAQMLGENKEEKEQEVKGERASVPFGVFFPEEVPSKAFRENVLEDIAQTAITYTVYKGAA